MKVIIRRKLANYDAWKKVVTDFDGLRKQYGSLGGVVYRNARQPDEVIIVFDWDDKKSYLEYFNRPDVQKALADSGETELFEVGEMFELEE
jgi:quinol monooxygenase YgiN